jgi:hypothetical protein
MSIRRAAVAIFTPWLIAAATGTVPLRRLSWRLA